uniref:Uncharacterized protein n=1 Tax=Triticum urartu TaxID=4572 RepID=A0A8R7R5Y7_TRIUA
RTSACRCVWGSRGTGAAGVAAHFAGGPRPSPVYFCVLLFAFHCPVRVLWGGGDFLFFSVPKILNQSLADTIDRSLDRLGLRIHGGLYLFLGSVSPMGWPWWMAAAVMADRGRSGGGASHQHCTNPNLDW